MVDSKGSLLVVDSHNHRIQLLNPDYTFGAMLKVKKRDETLVIEKNDPIKGKEFVGNIQVDHPLARPTTICLDTGNRQLWVRTVMQHIVKTCKGRGKYTLGCLTKTCL